MKDVEKTALYLGVDTNPSIASKETSPIPELDVDKRFGKSGFKPFEIDGAPAGNSVTLMPYPANKGSYVATYYNYINSDRSQKAGFTMFDETGVVDLSFGINGSLTIQLEQGAYTIPMSTFVDAEGRLITYANSVRRERAIVRQTPYLICMDNKGGLDDTFGKQGLLNLDELVRAHFISNDPKFDKFSCRSVFFDPNGGCYFNGELTSTAGHAASLMVRLDANGVLDETFGTRGGVIIGFDDEVSAGKFLDGLVVHGTRIVSVFTHPADAEWSLVRAFTLKGEPDLSYGSEGKVELEGLIVRGYAVHADNTLRLVGFGMDGTPRHEAASVWAINETGGITSRFNMLLVPPMYSQWRTASMSGDRIYCSGDINHSLGMLGCYLKESGELDRSFAKDGYGMPLSAYSISRMPPVLTPNSSLLVAGQWEGVAAVFAVATSRKDV